MKTKVIYIAGQAYSGSTFLCALLGIHPQMEPVSELAKWTSEYLSKPNRPCACGKKALECEFWNNIEQLWINKCGADAMQRTVKLQHQFEHISSIWTFKLSQSSKPSSDFQEYETLTTSLYKSISTISERPIIVDSSKIPGRALAISRMKELDVTIIHLVRDGMQFLESSLRRGKTISKNDPLGFIKSFNLGLNWSLTNFSAEYAINQSHVKGIRVRYEDLVSDPIPTLGHIGTILSFDPAIIQDSVSKKQPVNYRHMSTGSAHRYKGSKPIVDDFNKKPEIDQRLKLAFNLGAAFLSRKYGYS